jgi:hypothetical protein
VGEKAEVLCFRASPSGKTSCTTSVHGHEANPPNHLINNSSCSTKYSLISLLHGNCGRIQLVFIAAMQPKNQKGTRKLGLIRVEMVGSIRAQISSSSPLWLNPYPIWKPPTGPSWLSPRYFYSPLLSLLTRVLPAHLEFLFNLS